MFKYSKYFNFFCLILFISTNICLIDITFANDTKQIEIYKKNTKAFRKKYKNINNIYGKWKVVGYKFEKVDKPGYYYCRDVKDDKKIKEYVETENYYLEKQYSDEVGKIITISKDFYEYPYDEKLRFNYFIDGNKNKDIIEPTNYEQTRDFVFFNDGICKMETSYFCQKVNKPVYIIDTNELETHRFAHYSDQDDVLDLLFFSVYRKRYEDEDIEWGDLVSIDGYEFVLKTDNSVQMIKTNGSYRNWLILEKVE